MVSFVVFAITETIAWLALLGSIGRLCGKIDGTDGLFEFRERLCCSLFGLLSCSVVGHFKRE